MLRWLRLNWVLVSDLTTPQYIIKLTIQSSFISSLAQSCRIRQSHTNQFPTVKTNQPIKHMQSTFKKSLRYQIPQFPGNFSIRLFTISQKNIFTQIVLIASSVRFQTAKLNFLTIAHRHFLIRYAYAPSSCSIREFSL